MPAVNKSVIIQATEKCRGLSECNMRKGFEFGLSQATYSTAIVSEVWKICPPPPLLSKIYPVPVEDWESSEAFKDDFSHCNWEQSNSIDSEKTSGINKIWKIEYIRVAIRRDSK